jgi:hypothetical protein
MNAHPDRDRKRDGRKRLRVLLQRGIDGSRRSLLATLSRTERILDLLYVLAPRAQTPQSDSPPAAGNEQIGEDLRRLLRTLASATTALWRVRAKLTGEPKVELPAALRLLPRHVEAAWDALEAGGITVQDPRGQRYDPGLAVNPVTYIPDASVPPNTIVETLKPSVFWKDVLIQRADVILASPAEKIAKESGSSPPQEEIAK